MLAYILAIAVGLGSLILYMAAFFLPEVYRKYDLAWSGVGMFYALVLWVCAGQITGSVLLGQTASVVLLGWFGWQTLHLRRTLTPLNQRTPVSGATQSVSAHLRSQGEQLQTLLQRSLAVFSPPAPVLAEPSGERSVEDHTSDSETNTSAAAVPVVPPPNKRPSNKQANILVQPPLPNRVTTPDEIWDDLEDNLALEDVSKDKASPGTTTAEAQEGKPLVVRRSAKRKGGLPGLFSRLRGTLARRPQPQLSKSLVDDNPLASEDKSSPIETKGSAEVSASAEPLPTPPIAEPSLEKIVEQPEEGEGSVGIEDVSENVSVPAIAPEIGSTHAAPTVPTPLSRGELQPATTADLHDESNWVDEADEDEPIAVYIELDPEAEEPWSDMEDSPINISWSATETIIDVEIIATDRAIEPANPDKALVEESTNAVDADPLAAWIETEQVLGMGALVDQEIDYTAEAALEEAIDSAEVPAMQPEIEEAPIVAEVEGEIELEEPQLAASTSLNLLGFNSVDAKAAHAIEYEPSWTATTSELEDDWLDGADDAAIRSSPLHVIPEEQSEAESQPALTQATSSSNESEGWDILKAPVTIADGSAVDFDLPDVATDIASDSAIEPMPVPEVPSPKAEDAVANQNELSHPEPELQPIAPAQPDSDWDEILESVNVFRVKSTTSAHHPSRLGTEDDEEWF